MSRKKSKKEVFSSKDDKKYSAEDIMRPCSIKIPYN